MHCPSAKTFSNRAFPRHEQQHSFFTRTIRTHNRKNYESAIKEMRISIQVDAGGEYAEEAQYLLADLLYRTEKYNEAGVEFDRFYETFPKSSPRSRSADLVGTFPLCRKGIRERHRGRPTGY
jgi:outer membrane protein assembly factor BamD (BamD/ComL family)